MLAFAYLLSYPLVIGRADESHFLYGARRVLEGQVIYRDFFEILTPLGYYLFAAAFRVAGTTLLAARTTIALLESLGCAALFVLARRLSGTLEASLLALVFVGLCVPAWPYASPHWMSTAFGLLTAALLLAERWEASPRGRPFAAGLLGGVALCVQQQRGVFLAAWVPLALVVLAYARPRDVRWRRLRTEIVWATAGGALVTVVVLGHAAWAATPAALVSAIYGFARSNYAPNTAGTIAWAEVVALTGGWIAYTWLPLLRIAPLFLAVDAVALARRFGRPWTRSELEHASLWLLALLMAVSIWYLPDAVHVNFVLPFLLLPAARLAHALRTWRGWARFPVGRVVVTAAGVAAVALVVKSATNVVRAHASAPRRFDTAFGRLRGDEAMESLFRSVRDHLVAEPDRRRLLFSYPDDAWLYLALGADDPTRFSVLVPSIFPPELVAEATAALEARRPGTVVLLTSFAGDVVARTIDAHYEAVADVPPYRIYVRPAS